MGRAEERVPFQAALERVAVEMGKMASVGSGEKGQNWKATEGIRRVGLMTFAPSRSSAPPVF